MPAADGSSTRGGSTSVRGRVRSPHIFGGRPAAGSQHADSLGSCATPRLGQTDGRIAVSLNARVLLAGIKTGMLRSIGKQSGESVESVID